MTLEDLKNKKIHFVGIGGIGMSGLAHILADRGYSLSGSDLAQNRNTEKLVRRGVQIYQGHTPEAVHGKDILIISTDIKDNNSELQEARALGLPVLHRADLLAILIQGHRTVAISGTHGKTTTTGLMGWVFDVAELDPLVINGGIMNAWDSNVRVGSGEWCIVEADESDGSFLKLPKDIAVVTNIDPEHMEFHGSLEKLHHAFETFVTDLRPGGIAVLGIDHPEVYKLWQKIKSKQKCITYGLHKEADVKAENLEKRPDGTTFDLVYGTSRLSFHLTLPGTHNVQNAAGVAATALACGISEDALRKAFSTHNGVQRRFTHVGEWQGVTIIDDYAHHPVEIKATLAAARDCSQGRIIAVIEPHRYSRLEHHFTDFATCCESADLTIVLPVYSAQESPRDGVHHKALANAMKGDVLTCDEAHDLSPLIHRYAQPGDMVICLGAGSITTLSRSLQEQLERKCA